MPAFLSRPAILCALGEGADEVRRALFAPQPGGVAVSDFFSADRPLALGRVEGELPSVAQHPPEFHSRNNQLLARAVTQLEPELSALREKYGAARIGVVLGTSTSGIGEVERAVAHHLRVGGLPDGYHYSVQELGSPARFLATHLGLRGPTCVVSTACSSSAKSLATAARWLEAGFVDAVLTGGGDSLCRFTIAGFSALESVADARCNPLSRNRCGINIGEAAALFLMTREETPVRLAGWGETSDAHHMSAPEPSGRGAADAMRVALARAGLSPADVDYVNLHGTATPQNDAMESRAVASVLGLDAPVSSTKPLTGHTLGAAGALEAAIAWLTLTGTGELPPHWWDGERDPELPAVRLVAPGERAARPPRVVLSNSFAFGGSNASLAFVRS
jgi:3-oxoacyl-[acyl-carrier-protein] synthase-1